MATGDSAPLPGPPLEEDVKRGAEDRRSLRLIFSLLGVAVLLILAALLLRGSDRVVARHDGAGRQVVPTHAPAGRVPPAAGS